MTHEGFDGEHASPEPTGTTTPSEPASGATTPPPPHPDPAIGQPPPSPTRLARLGASWRTSMPLRIATAVVIALLISGIGFAAGTTFGNDEDPHHHHQQQHHVTADHPFWQDHLGWFHRYTDTDTDSETGTPSHHRHTPPTGLSAARPTPSATASR